MYLETLDFYIYAIKFYFTKFIKFLKSLKIFKKIS